MALAGLPKLAKKLGGGVRVRIFKTVRLIRRIRYTVFSFLIHPSLSRIRSRDADRSFALTISYNQRPKHYKIAIDQAGKYAIDDGQKFECLMDVS